MNKVIGNAVADVRAALAMRRLWMALAREDIGDQHRRTWLGPFWLLINYLALAGTFIFVFQVESDPGYAGHVAIGLLVWFYMMETITLSISLFVREESFIKGTTLPLSVYVMRLTIQSLIRFGYALPGCVGILALGGIGLNTGWLWSAVGILLIAITTPAAVILLAFLGAYVPDSQFIVNNLMRLGMFLTPVFWAYEGTGGVRHVFYHWNPFTYFIEIVRIPILTGSVPFGSFLLCAAITLLIWTAAIVVLGKLRKRVVFVL